MGEGTVPANGLTVWYETFGDPVAPALVLIAGLGYQGMLWPVEFCERLAGGGRYVIRFDNREVGHSTYFGEDATYTYEDMADDVVGLLDALGIATAHIVGISMGGVIAQWVAIRHSARVLSLTSMMAGPYTPAEAAAQLRAPTVNTMEWVRQPDPGTRDGRIAQAVDRWRQIWGTVPFDEADMTTMEAQMYDRAYRPEAPLRHMAAERRTPSRHAALQQLAVRTLVIHGTADPLVPSDRGEAIAALIPGARLQLIPDMGHCTPRACWDGLVNAILAHTEAAELAPRDVS